MPNYLLLLNHKKHKIVERPKVRIFSVKNKENFKRKLKETNWSAVLSSSDGNEGYSAFVRRLKSEFDKQFPLTKLSRNRMKDKKWITSGLKKCSRQKNKLYRDWINKSESESKYKTYKKLFQKSVS